MAEVPIRRRGFQFGLRAMFLAVTVLALLLGWELRVVQQRRLLRASLESRGCRFTRNIVPSWMDKPTTRPELFPQWRRCLGDEHFDAVTFARAPSPTDDEAAEAKRLFPEAFVYVSPSPSEPPLFQR